MFSGSAKGAGGRVLRPSRLVTGLFEVLARLRGARALHPRGVFVGGELTVAAQARLPVPAGTRPVVARLSKGVGTGGGRADVLGLAVRVPPWSGVDRPWDLTLSSTGGARFTWLLPVLARHWGRASFGSIVPYRLRGRRVWLVAVPRDLDPDAPASLDWVARRVGERPARFTLHVVGAGRSGGKVADLTLHTVLVGAHVDEVCFDPVVNCPPEMPLWPRWLRRLRLFAYRGSRRGHHAPEAALHALPRP
nr:hypothetical protein GCM10020241_04000 [Streptoalloteichus tenebrarius]